MAAKSKTKQINNKAELGRKYFDVLDVYTNNILTEIAAKSSELSLSTDHLKIIEKISIDQKMKARNWGFDQLSKVLQD
tara:strand:- start:715 stop:948 length:234 start_codon:yes stop_codon:yes gene_type:complete